VFQLKVTVDEISVEPGCGLVICALATVGALFLQLATVKAVLFRDRRLSAELGRVYSTPMGWPPYNTSGLDQ
jgi:hypothetical protein